MNSIYFFNNPYDSASRAIQARMATLNIPFLMMDRLDPSQSLNFPISFLPTILIATPSGTEVSRLEDSSQMSNANVTNFWNQNKGG